MPKGQKAPAFAVPNPDAPVSGAKDAAGDDMWFNGQPAFAPNPAVIMPAGRQGHRRLEGRRQRHRPRRAAEAVGREVPEGRHLRAALRAAAGRPPDRQGHRQEAPEGRLEPGPGRRRHDAGTIDERRIARQLRANAKLANRLLKYKGPEGNVVRAGNDAKGVATIAFFPATKTVKVGDTVTFTMSQHSIETHNVAFGPKPYLDEHAKRFFGPVFEPFVTFRSEAPGTPISFDGANHGNGYVNTGVLDANPVTRAAEVRDGHVHQGRHLRRTTARCTATTWPARSSSSEPMRRLLLTLAAVAALVAAAPAARPARSPRSTSGRATTPRPS